MLGEEPYKGASFVVDNYGGPVTSYTGEWAYFDPRFSEGEVTLGPKGFVVTRDMRHLWSSDRLTNSSYTKPTYFLCMRPQTPIIAAMLRNSKGSSYGCERSPLAVRALAGNGGAMQNRVVARDDLRNSWMIVKLDWELPPYLLAHSGTNKWLRVRVDRRQRNTNGTEISVEYQYAQQEGEVEADTEVRVYDIGSGRTCESQQNRRTILVSARGTRQVMLPASFSGNIVVSVIPQSVKRRGFEYFSEVIVIPASVTESVSACAYVATPVNFVNGYSVLEGDLLSVRWSSVEYAAEYFVEAHRADDEWSWTGSVSGPTNSVEIEVPPSNSDYWVRITPCNGVVCGSRSEPMKAARLIRGGER
jgi:hypothetical protein